MRSASNNNSSSVDTINAAATAIVSAEARVQPSSSVQKRRWGGCWSNYWCFGSQKSSKRIGHAVLVPEPRVQGAVVPSAENQSHSTAVAVPFIAPPSSPASFLQSDPPSATHSPAGLLSLSVSAYSPGGPNSIFAIGPYAHETQLVTPPVFSAFTTQPSTAPFTPPPESVQLTTPSSPEVPFAQLLTSSLERARRNNGTNQKFSLSHYEFQSYPLYPGSPGGQLISPGSAMSYSGTTSPFPDRLPILEFRMGEAPKLLGFEYFTTRKWGSRLGSGTVTPDGVGLGSRLASGTVTPDGLGLGSRLASGTVTPDGVGLGSRLGSGTVTPDGVGLGSRLASGTVTPDGVGLGSRLASGTVTPDGVGLGSRISSGTVTPHGVGLQSRQRSGSLTPDGVGPIGLFLENQISEIASVSNKENGSKTDETIVDHRVSFELSGEEVARCLENKSMSTCRTFFEYSHDSIEEEKIKSEKMPPVSDENLPSGETSSGTTADQKTSGETEEEHYYRKHRSVTLGSIKEFNFDNSKDIPDKPPISSEWWANEAIAQESRPSNNWSFFPLLQPEVS
ncbi:uncharacterized protein LOC126673745 [Mercurialis annua]|uniref:uncharacterized protein LOC126673745 n=1 Tax=Mercurialis annua TaxID=3986 RepID=UPI00215E18D4|nr:uncharacterized protein LOC126673745 [Mercurialis annua]